MTHIKKICDSCGSENVLADAYAAWNFDKQDWELHGDVFDKGSVCEDCSNPCRIIDQPAEPVKYMAFCQDETGSGTMWIGEAEGVTIELAQLNATQACARDWNQPPASIKCVGLATGDVKIAMWDDD